MNKINRDKFLFAMKGLVVDTEAVLNKTTPRLKTYSLLRGILLRIKILADVFEKDTTKNPYHRPWPKPPIGEDDIVRIKSTRGMGIYRPRIGDIGIVADKLLSNLPDNNYVLVEAETAPEHVKTFGYTYFYDIPRENLERIA